jgi:hypothetical protein
LFAFAVSTATSGQRKKSQKGGGFQSTNAGRDGEIETRLKAMGEGIYRDTTRARQAVIKIKELFEQAQMVLCEYRKSDTSSDEDRHELAVELNRVVSSCLDSIVDLESWLPQKLAMYTRSAENVQAFATDVPKWAKASVRKIKWNFQHLVTIANDQEWKTKYLMSIRKSHSSQPPAATSLNSQDSVVSKWSLDSEDDDTNPISLREKYGDEDDLISLPSQWSLSSYESLPRLTRELLKDVSGDDDSLNFLRSKYDLEVASTDTYDEMDES